MNRKTVIQYCITRQLVAAVLMFLLGLSTLQAAETTANEQIHNAVRHFMQQEFSDDSYRFDVGYIDKRLKLKACDIPLQVYLPASSRQLGYTTVGVRCNGEKLWKIHVPVTIKQFAQVLVAARTLPRGKSLQPGDVRLARRELSRLTSGYFSNLSAVNDMELKRTVRRDSVLTPSNVMIPKLVKRGDSITILAKSGHLTIHVKGKALMHGRKGDKIRVKNVRSKREVQAVVVGPGLVKVAM